MASFGQWMVHPYPQLVPNMTTHADRKHAKKSPSGSKRWGTCPGSIREIGKANLPDEENVYSKAGLVHPKLIGKGDHPAANDVEEALIYLRQFKTCKFIFERPVFIHIIQDTGTPDIIGWDAKNRHLHIFDYKNGQGYVEANDNSQCSLYASGVANWLLTKGIEVQKFFNHIMQPRTQGNQMRCEELTPDQMRAWTKVWQAKSDACDAPDAPLVPSPDACHWCAVRAQCPALRQQAITAAQQDFQKFLEPSVHPAATAAVGVLNDTQLRVAMERIPLVELWIKAIKAELLKRPLAGQPPGFKLVEGKSNRQWADEDALVNAVIAKGLPDTDAFKPREVIGIGEAEKLIGKKAVAALCVKPTGKPTLVPNDDPRPPMSNAKLDFAEELENE